MFTLFNLSLTLTSLILFSSWFFTIIFSFFDFDGRLGYSLFLFSERNLLSSMEFSIAFISVKCLKVETRAADPSLSSLGFWPLLLDGISCYLLSVD
jgi:hypothetical protein